MPAVALRPPCGSAWPIAVPVSSTGIVHVAGRNFRGRCAFSSAVCCAPIAWPTLGAVAHPVTHACTVVAEPSFTKVGSRGQGAAKCAVFGGFVLRARAVPQYEADVPPRLAPRLGMAPRCTMWKVPCAVCVHGPGPVSGRFGESRAVILPLTRPAWSVPGTNLLPVCTVRCEADCHLWLPWVSACGSEAARRLPAGSGVAAG